MFEMIRKILDSPAAIVALVALFVAGIVFLARLESDVLHLQTDVTRLQTDVTQLQVDVRHLQTDVTQLKTDVTQLQQQAESNHTEVLKAIDAAVDEMLTALANHTHDADGKVRVTLPQ